MKNLSEEKLHSSAFYDDGKNLNKKKKNQQMQLGLDFARL